MSDDTIEYSYSGAFDRQKLTKLFEAEFSKSVVQLQRSEPNFLALVGYIENDAFMTDIRWAAYLLATTYWEAKVLQKANVPLKTDPSKTKEIKYWLLFASKPESSPASTRRYYDPVKVLEEPGGTILITERDGDQFRVKPSGQYAALAKPKGVPGAKPGAVHANPTAQGYVSAAGAEKTFFGRGFCQLTWWYNYATAGAALKRGLDFVKNPELVMDPATAYQIMSHGMRTGKIFANNRKFADYFNSTKTDYQNARNMINGGDKVSYKPIADIAVKFENILLGARLRKPETEGKTDAPPKLLARTGRTA
jgi:hypothetical protein